MPLNIFALCGEPGTPSVKRVTTTNDVQQQLEPYFTALENSFRDGINEEIDFDGRWKPDRDQLVRVVSTAEIEAIEVELRNDPLAIDAINPADFDDEQIRALLVSRTAGQRSRLVVQAFSNQQRLSRKFALIQNGIPLIASLVLRSLSIQRYTRSSKADI